MREAWWRSAAKAYCWRCCGSTITFCIAFAVTGRFVTSGLISGTELVVKPLFYWLHERAWAYVDWGRR